ncbi:DNA polymerase III subunit beta [Sphingomonas sp. 3-13AW]|uniref:DNA polymerase III subunit beta n=1 Tax=Sphingomonas sp. 3-13AW TaxID=3050450 RepID=UPI003BB58452
MPNKQLKVSSVAEIDVKTLRSVLKDVVGVVEARNTVPVLAAVLLRVETASLTVVGTDLDVWVERRASAIDTQDSFGVAVDAALLHRIAGKLPENAQAKLKFGEGKLTVSAGRSRFELSTLPEDDFPIIPLSAAAHQFDLPATTLGGVLGRVSHAISTDETRYYLNGVFVHAPGEGDLRFATTDGHRLARIVLPLPEGASGIPDVILPRKAARILAGLLDRFEGQVAVALSPTRIRFEVGETVLTTKVIDGEFPDYNRVIPAENERLIAISRSDLAEAVGRVSVVSSDKTKTIRVEVEPGKVMLIARSVEHGLASEEVPCSYSGAPLTIGFNGKFIADTLGQLSAETIEILLSDSAGATVWRDREDSPATFVVMPMKV